MNEEIINIINEKLLGKILKHEVCADGKLNIFVSKEYLIEVIKFLKETFDFNYLILVSGVDRIEFLQVVYHLSSLNKKNHIVVKVDLNRDNPTIASISSIFRGAEWQEREVYDMFGINFEGHPDLRRILLPDDWEGNPLRKDYPAPDYKILTEKYSEREYKILNKEVAGF